MKYSNEAYTSIIDNEVMGPPYVAEGLGGHT